MRLTLWFVEPRKFPVNVIILKEDLMKFKSLDELATHIVDTEIYSKWLKVYEGYAKTIKMPPEKLEAIKERYRLKMVEYVKKWLIEAVMQRR
jgi:hypothetical protein